MGVMSSLLFVINIGLMVALLLLILPTLLLEDVWGVGGGVQLMCCLLV